MIIKENKFRKNTESDWMMKSSIRYDIGGNTKKILQEIFKDGNVEAKKKLNSKEYKSPPSLFFPRSNPVGHSKVFGGSTDDVEEETNVHLTKKENNIGYIFENFDESQHLNGCPLKWLYYKKLSERNAACLVRTSCSRKSSKNEIKKVNSANVRDKTPAEVKIHKINLMERSDVNYWKQNSIEEPDIRREIEIHKKNLASKLNWKLHDDTPDDTEIEISSQLSFSNCNYLRPRPLRELKPLLSILLLPHKERSCCPSKIQIQSNSVREEPMESPSLSIKSLELPLVKIKEESTNRINSRGRWGSKSYKLGKKLQVPNQVTINLRRKHFAVKPTAENKNKTSASKASLKKSNEKGKQAKETKSLSSLFYELSNKMNYKSENNEHFEDLIRDLTVEDENFKFQRFFQYNAATRKYSGIRQKEKCPNEKKIKQVNYPSASKGKSKNLNLQRGKAFFFERFSDSRNFK